MRYTGRVKLMMRELSAATPRELKAIRDAARKEFGDEGMASGGTREPRRPLPSDLTDGIELQPPNHGREA